MPVTMPSSSEQKPGTKPLFSAWALKNSANILQQWFAIAVIWHQGSTSRKIRGIIPFDGQNHVKCAFWRVRLRIRTLIKRYDHVRVYSQEGMTINVQTATFMPFTNGILQVQKMTLTETVRVK
jgi:hypothetical protein